MNHKLKTQGKCQRCGDEPIIQEGVVLAEAAGPDATVDLSLKGIRRQKIVASVCDSCAKMLRRLGWQ